jgi:YegS/Rv2252/BmrU family lipid kinase
VGGTVVAVGGDGLVGALAGAVAGTPGRLGVVPAGRGNDFARSLGLPAEPVAAARGLARAAERRIDVGEVDGRPFVGIASVGVDAEANRLANRAPGWLGPSVYPLAGVVALARWRHATFTLTIDDRTVPFRGFAVGVGNGGFYGGGLHLLPDAALDDGALDLCLFGEDRRLRLLREIPARRTAGHAANPTVRFDRGRTVTIEADRPLVVYADGEPIGVTPSRIGVRPGALAVLAPEHP